jgi:pimeloyl-ACP methyl ester carboxylesterase
MISVAGATGRSSASRRRRTVPGHRDAGPRPVPPTVRGRVVRVLAATVVAVLATVLAVGPASPAAAFRATCHEVDVPVTVAGRTATMHGTLCLPHHRTNTVVVLVPGSTYNHVYWDFPLQPQRYSFRRGLNQHGLATFVVDRLGTGLSSRPPSTEVTAQAQAAGIHAAVQLLRAGRLGGVTFSKVVIGGHSLGSVLAIGAVSTYPEDADGVLITGFIHNFNQEAVGRFFQSLHPAASDPAFAQAQPPYDAGYLTTMPGTRNANFYAPARADPAVVARDEATKDVVSTTENDTTVAFGDPAVSRSIQVPVLLVLGEFDPLFLCTPDGSPCTAEALLAQGTPFYSANARLQAFVLPDAGHSLNLFPNARHAWKAVGRWVDECVASRTSVPASRTAGCPS